MLALVLLLYFWASGLAGLDRFPKIHEDESWQAAPGYTFWAEGHFGTDLFAGFYGMEHHYYGFMPLFPIMVGAALHLFGVGLFQARLVPLMLILLALTLTHRLGSKLFSGWHGTLAVAILVGWRIAGPFPHLVSGIPMADVARIVRYDSAVPLFSLLAVLRFVSTLKRQNIMWGNKISSLLPFLAVGILVGLATLSHLYGAFWLPALALSLFWFSGWRAIKPTLVMGLGFGVTLAPWFIFVASGWQDFLNQGRNYSDRFGLLDIRFYLINLLLETERYDPILNGAKLSLGAWLWLIICGLSLVWFVRQSLKPDNGNEKMAQAKGAARLIIISLITTGGLFALLISFKTFSYLAILWPLFSLSIAAGFIHVWQQHTTQRWWRPLLTTLFALAMLEGGITGWRMQRLAHQTTPYQTYTQQISEQIPPASRLMGLQHYWLGLSQHSQDYRSILVPIFWTNPKYVLDPVPFAQAVDVIPPDIILLDQIMLDFLDQTADPTDSFHSLYLEIQAYLNQPQAELIGEIIDPTYGRMQIYQLQGETVGQRR